MNTLELATAVAKTLDANKADRIDVIEIADLTILSDYFVIASANNTTHVKSLADEVEVELKKLGKYTERVEGYQNANWIILDYIDVVVHIFYEETRNFYNLEKLWADGKKLDIVELLK
ncbi:MAG: ribosome silencing factor [Oscillospiraceae bacterium]